VSDAGDQELRRKGRGLTIAARVAAASSGAYLATLLGPAGGAAAGQGLAELGETLVGVLVNWEWRRVHRTLLGFKDQVDNRLAAGEEIRDEIANPDCPGALSVFESVIETAARSVEERKCDLIANLYAAVAFDPTVSPEDALLYLRRIRVASWRQLVALRYFEDERREEERRIIAADGDEGAARIHPSLEAELSEAARTLELIGIGQDGGSVANPSNTMGGGQIISSSAARVCAAGLGLTISRLGQLPNLVTEEELDAIALDLRFDNRTGSAP
jgi:hypothetical protein